MKTDRPTRLCPLRQRVEKLIQEPRAHDRHAPPPLPPIIIDTREQAPWTFPPDVATVPGALAAGDHSLAGLDDLAAIERKSLPDLVACCGRERDRFKRELQRLRAYRCRAVIIEATPADVLAHACRSKVAPAAVLGSVCSWQTRYQIPFTWAGSADHAATICLALLHTFHRQCCELAAALGIAG